MKVDDPQAVLSELARVRSHFQLRGLAAVMDAPLPIPGALVVRLGQSGGQIADVLRKDRT